MCVGVFPYAVRPVPDQHRYREQDETEKFPAKIGVGVCSVHDNKYDPEQKQRQAKQCQEDCEKPLGASFHARILARCKTFVENSELSIFHSLNTRELGVPSNEVGSNFFKCHDLS